MINENKIWGEGNHEFANGKKISEIGNTANRIIILQADKLP